jgi:hypothetical protein
MNAYKTIFKISLFVFSLHTFTASAIDWKQVKCPDRLNNAYITEAIQLIASGLKSYPDSICLNQENFKLFDVGLNDMSDRPLPEPILINNDYAFKTLEKSMNQNGVLKVVFKVSSGKTEITDNFSLYFDTKGCAAFFDLPTKAILINRCKALKK